MSCSFKTIIGIWLSGKYYAVLILSKLFIWDDLLTNFEFFFIIKDYLYCKLISISNQISNIIILIVFIALQAGNGYSVMLIDESLPLKFNCSEVSTNGLVHGELLLKAFCLPNVDQYQKSAV